MRYQQLCAHHFSMAMSLYALRTLPHMVILVWILRITPAVGSGGVAAEAAELLVLVLLAMVVAEAEWLAEEPAAANSEGSQKKTADM